MTDETLPPVRLVCPLSGMGPDSCNFVVTLPEPPADYRPTWHPRLRREGYADEQKEAWTGLFRDHLGTAHTAAELLEHVAWEPHLNWANDEF